MNEKRTPSRRSRAGGFTLLEVMIVVTIMGIISGIAVPSFVETIRQSHMRAAVDGLSAFLQGTSIEVKKTRRHHSVLFTNSGATRYVSENCTGETNGSFSFDDDVIVLRASGPALGNAGLPSFAVYNGTSATVGAGWTVASKQCALFRADPGSFGNTVGPGGVFIRYRNDDDGDYGGWVLKPEGENRLKAYTKEHGIWVER
ncbi:MAG: prepilin-type N-terminal cleavage/methylation domain-containing protein [Fibrobacterales bacterium]|nr:prepilin-type N-terminal cleavage/methylation domain-containing protein [Fibrobacterales bacterium]